MKRTVRAERLIGVTKRRAIAALEALLIDRTRVLRPDAPGTLTTRNNLASLLRQAGRVKEAVAALEALLVDRTAALGRYSRRDGGVVAGMLSLEQVEAFLADRHGHPVRDLGALHGGFWSSAFAYRVGDRQLVVRFGGTRDGFEADRMAMAFDGPDLPVPVVLEVGDAFGGAYALLVRHHGRFLESVRPDEALVTGPAIVRLLGALRAIPTDPDEPVAWPWDRYAAESTWRRWLVDALLDDPSRPVHGWRTVLAGDAGLDRLFGACEARIRGLADACPERRDVLHGDLLHANPLISEDGSRITAVFSWKCSVRGDFLFDTAWCTFWGAFHPGIAAVDVWERMLAAPRSAGEPERSPRPPYAITAMSCRSAQPTSAGTPGSATRTP